MKKRFIAGLLSMILALSCVVPVLADKNNDETRLEFNKDGKFTILNYDDFQDGAKMKKSTKNFIRRTLEKVKPDLVVLGGDNIGGYETKTEKKTKKAIDEFMSIFEEFNVPTAICFGNHDEEKTEMTPEMQMEYYRTFSCNVSCDQPDDVKTDLHGCGTYNLPVYSSDGKSVAFNVWIFDSGTDYDGEENYEYDWVRDDQLEWYKSTSDKLKKENGGKTVYSLSFQHIVLPEIFDALKQVDENYDGAIKKKDKYYCLPDNASGLLPEAPCPTMFNPNDHQFEVMKKQGDCLAVVTGHDHNNTFDIPYENMRFIATPTAGFKSYGIEQTRGARVFVIDENDPKSFTTEILLAKEEVGDTFSEKLTYNLAAKKRTMKTWIGNKWKSFKKLFKSRA